MEGKWENKHKCLVNTNANVIGDKEGYDDHEEEQKKEKEEKAEKAEKEEKEEKKEKEEVVAN